jgi:hypothetical protein
MMKCYKVGIALALGLMLSLFLLATGALAQHSYQRSPGATGFVVNSYQCPPGARIIDVQVDGITGIHVCQSF